MRGGRRKPSRLLDRPEEKRAVEPVKGNSAGFADKRDGKKYRTVKIGAQTWMAENLNHKIDDSWCYDDKDGNCQKYGRLYDWYAAMKACPVGWRLPNDKDWDDLTETLGGRGGAGAKLKSKSQWNGTDDYGFSALPGGRRSANGSFNSAGAFGGWWGATSRQDVVSSYSSLDSTGGDKKDAYSVRCLR